MNKFVGSAMRFQKIQIPYLTPLFLSKRCNSGKCKPKVMTKTLNNGHKMPVFGLGTWLSLDKAKTINGVKHAIKVGYRMIDAAMVYENETDVGKGIKQALDEKLCTREELFVTSKLWNTFHSPHLVEKALKSTLKDLQLDYLDLYLIHWPVGYKEGSGLFPKDACDKLIFSDVDYVETWKAMEKLQEKCLVKSIGISNFNKAQIERILKIAKIPPAVNQCECHPHLTQAKLIHYCNSKKIAFMAYSPLGASANRPYAEDDEERLVLSKTVIDIGKKHKKSAAQVLIRFQIQRGNIVAAHALDHKWIEENLNVFDFELSDEDMKKLCALNIPKRYVCIVQDCGKHKYYPFYDDY